MNVVTIQRAYRHTSRGNPKDVNNELVDGTNIQPFDERFVNEDYNRKFTQSATGNIWGVRTVSFRTLYPFACPNVTPSLDSDVNQFLEAYPDADKSMTHFIKAIRQKTRKAWASKNGTPEALSLVSGSGSVISAWQATSTIYNPYSTWNCCRFRFFIYLIINFLYRKSLHNSKSHIYLVSTFASVLWSWNVTGSITCKFNNLRNKEFKKSL